MEQIIAALAGAGTSGIFIAYLIVKNRQLESAVDVKDKRIDELQERRITEAIISTNAANALAASNEKMAEALEKIEERLGRMGRIEDGGRSRR